MVVCNKQCETGNNKKPMKYSKSGHKEAEKYRKLILAGLESVLDDPMSVEESIGNPVEPVASIGSAEFRKGSSESQKMERKTWPINLEETLQLSEARRAEQVDQLLRLDRDRL
jgi:hypothetical protein